MALLPGTRLGPYDVVAKVGEGGMGEVYRARDTKLSRDVAIKVLPDAFARDAERLARFRREAQALAALNHPHIAQIYQLEEIGPSVALVMEFVEGRTLAEAIAARALDVDEALRLAADIAAGLETAHEKGIIHRDLKPANVKITPDGHAKILDFGLAKALGQEGSHATVDQMNSPTLTARATEAGLVLGTAAYMSPEQARGKAVDKRTDIWAFGAVLYEILTCRRAFEGETVSDTLASVLRSEPDWSLLPAAVPAHIRALVARCLDRDVSRRLRDIGEARLTLTGATSSVMTTALQVTSTATRPPALSGSAPPWPWMIATAVLSLAVVTLLSTSTLVRSPPVASASESLELAMQAPFGTEFRIGGNSGLVAISPDGRRIAFVAATDKVSSLWIRSLDRDDARALPGTEGASNQFWSPDGRRLGFFANAKLWTVDIAGGLPEEIADAAGGRGGAWNEDGTIIFCPVGGAALMRVATTGGPVATLTTLDRSRGEDAHYWPVFLPGGTRYLYFVRSVRAENSGIYLGALDGTPARRLVPSLSSGIVARGTPTGRWYLMWARDTDLIAQPLDVETGTLSGEAGTIAQDVAVLESQRLLYASASRTGLVAWATARASQNAMAVYARDGRRLRVLDFGGGSLVQPALSPDGHRLLFTRVERGTADIFMHDLRTGATERLTDHPEYDENPRWTPDGRAMTYVGRDNGVPGVMRLAIGSGARPVKQAAGDNSNGCLETADSRFLICNRARPETRFDVVAVSRTDPNVSVTLAGGPADEAAFALAADGRWLMMTTQQGSRSAVAVARLNTDGAIPVLGVPHTVIEGLVSMAFRPDGREVFIVTADGWVKAIALTLGKDTAAVGAATALFKLPNASRFSVNPIGTEFVVEDTPHAAGQTLRVLTNWETRLKK